MNPYESSCLHLRALIFIMKLVKARLLHFASRILSVEPEKLLQNLLAKASCLNWSIMNPYESSCLHLCALIIIMKLVKARLLLSASRNMSVTPEKPSPNSCNASNLIDSLGLVAGIGPFWTLMNQSSCLHSGTLIIIRKLVKARLLLFASRILSVKSGIL